MRVIGVIDLKGGRAVHARGGQRDRYAPVRSSLAADSVAGDVVALAQGYRRAGVGEIYVADLDAIGGRPPDSASLLALADVGLPLWVDAGIDTVAGAHAVLSAGAARVVIGLETLRSWESLAAIVASIGAERTVFSLDLRDGAPVSDKFSDINVTDIAQRAASSGVHTIIVLDLARVGSGAGVDANVIQAVRAAVPTVDLVVGGGIRDDADLVHAKEAGATGALVGTALHTRSLSVLQMG
jgi:phosphoribosylformimino-5-aminoimidazole carboxamide ribotide isomerase